jgi:hypothetical protein
LFFFFLRYPVQPCVWYSPFLTHQLSLFCCDNRLVRYCRQPPWPKTKKPTPWRPRKKSPRKSSKPPPPRKLSSRKASNWTRTHTHTLDTTTTTTSTTSSSSSSRKWRLESNHGTLTSRWTPGRACSVGNNDTPTHPIHNTHVLAPTLFYLTHLRFTQVILVTKNIVNFMQLFYTTTAIRPCCVATDNRLRDPASHSRCRVRTLFRTRQLPFQ